MDVFKKARKIASEIHSWSRSKRLDYYEMEILFHDNMYRVLVFNTSKPTPSRVVFLKIIKESYPASITIFEHSDLILFEKAHELESFFIHFSASQKRLIHHALGTKIEQTKEKKWDRLLDRYNDYLHLAKLFKDPYYKKRAKRLLQILQGKKKKKRRKNKEEKK